MSKPFYITTTLPYVNSDPHVGFAMELVRADIIARAKKLQGFEVFFNTGTDEHGQKLLTGALEAGKDIKQYVDEYAESFKKLPKALGVLEDIHFIRTTDSHHEGAAQEFWRKCDKNGYIYKKNYQTKYCVGCELEKTDSELEDGKCPLHPKLEIELRNEENYFFKFSVFGDKLLDFYKNHPNFVIPDFRYNEIKAFVGRGLEDFSISRLKEKMSWGVPVPDDDNHIMYVWFDALVNYISTLGWPEDEKNFNKFWKEGAPVQYCGKDNLRQQSAMWQAMLMSVDLPNTSHIIINGFLTGDGGVKMSKSLGNTINPFDIINEYGADAFRFFVAKEISNFEDSPFTMERFKTAYNSGLANGLGNLLSRIMKLAEDNLESPLNDADFSYSFVDGYIVEKLNEFRTDLAIAYIWDKIGELDREIQEKKPWESKDKELLQNLVKKIGQIGHMLKPFLPETSKNIIDSVRKNKKPDNMFPRKD
ncbi:MAG: methionine--tRNA ligase [Minisyncoccia bacterium]